MKIDYNAPFILTFALICMGVYAADLATGGRFGLFLFSLLPYFDPFDPLSYFRLVSHVFGHADARHLTLNLSIILLVGPILEEKYGTKTLILLCLTTAVATSLFYLIFFSNGLQGASGIAFTLIILSSFTNVKKGTIPLTFLLICVLYLGNEIYNALWLEDNVAQMAHILGGVCGSVFGFTYAGGGSR